MFQLNKISSNDSVSAKQAVGVRGQVQNVSFVNH